MSMREGQQGVTFTMPSRALDSTRASRDARFNSIESENYLMTTTTATPATLAATRSPRAVDASSTVDADAPVAVDPATALRVAYDAVNASTSYSHADAATLKAATLAAYVSHASPLARPLDGASVLPRNYKGAVAADVWQIVTGSLTAPVTATRTPADASLATYLSTFARVATNAGYGLGSLESVDTVTVASKEISAAETLTRVVDAANVARLQALTAHADYVAFVRDVATRAEREAFAIVEKCLTGRAGRRHAEAFAAHVATLNGQSAE